MEIKKLTLDEIIQKRCSYRKYSKKTIEKDKIMQIINTGVLSPSSRNGQPIEFYVVSCQTKLKEISDFSKNYYKTNKGREIKIENIFYYAPHVIFMFINNKSLEKTGFIDLGLCLMSMELKAEELGFSTCTVGLARAGAKKIHEICNVGDEKEFGIGVCLGFGEEGSCSEKSRKKPIVKFLD